MYFLHVVSKPKLIALEACHRPAPSEGQKENKKGNANMVKKLRIIYKVTFAIVFVTLMIAWPMTLRTVSAGYVDDRMGISYSYYTSYPNGYPYLPQYMECCHY
jgi:hypothetical protein